MSTPYDSSDVDFLDALGVPAFKAASISMVEPNFLRYIASKNKPIICSTGLCTLEEISQSLNFLPDYKKYLMLLQCTTDYPAQIEDSNILSMLKLKKTTGCLVGYSDHTVNNVSVIAAIAHGATVIEKHLTLDKSAEGPDQENSYEPFEFKELVSVIRQTEQALGNGIKKPSERELKNIHGMRRGLVAKKDLHIGEKLEFSDFYLKRPANGISLIEFIQLKETTIKKGQIATEEFAGKPSKGHGSLFDGTLKKIFGKDVGDVTMSVKQDMKSYSNRVSKNAKKLIKKDPSLSQEAAIKKAEKDTAKMFGARFFKGTRSVFELEIWLHSTT